MIGRILFLALLFLTCASRATAQGVIVSGMVVDESGARVPGAAVTLAGSGIRETRMTDAAGEYRFTAVTPGEYEVTVMAAGFSSDKPARVMIGSTAVTVPSLTLAIAGLGETVIVSASRTESTVLDAPATMTVVPGSTLAAMPSQSYADVLRTVPGMNVVQLSARDINVTSRQATSTLATSQLALLDGRSLYLDFFGLVLWDFVPASTDDIKQIEVVRGPASAVWGANALTGVVNIITKSPREVAGTTSVTLGGGFFNRDFGSTEGDGVGGLFSTSVTTSQIAGDRWSYRLSGGYYNSAPYARPVGRIPVIADPRDPTGRTPVGGAPYPIDAEGALGTAYRNQGTSQPKFDARVDQELRNARVTYAAGIAGTRGTIYTGIGPFDIQPGSTMSYGRMSYSRGAGRFSAFTNIVDAEAPNLLVPNPLNGRPLELNFKSQTYDVEGSHAVVIGRRQTISYGGNFRRNRFDITLAPAAKDRNEIGGYVQDDIFLDRVRLSIGARVDKFGNIEDPAFSPRLSLSYRVADNHVLRAGFNRAFRSPSSINNYLDIALVTPVDLSGLRPFLPAPLQPFVAMPFPLVVRAVGSELPIGSTPQAHMKQESLTAFEGAYTGTFDGRTTLGVAFYVNEMDDNINFVQLPFNLDPYTAANPPPGFPLAAAPLLAAVAQVGFFLPRTAFTYMNLGPIRQQGVELSVDHRLNSTVNTFANYSWQGEPEVLDDPNPYPVIELSLPPTHRFNIGGTYSGRRLLGSLVVSYTDKGFWTDVLNSAYHGFTDAFTMVNGSFGVRWNNRVTTTIKSTNLLNREIQQHVFGDILGRSVTAEVRFDLVR
jgi:outer membrane receptor for ferrienterochelin and colicins